METKRRTITRAGRIGGYHVYTDGAYDWYYAGRPGAPEWYVYRPDTDADGDYVDFNPAECDPARYAPWIA